MKVNKSDPVCRLCGKPVGPHNPDFPEPTDMHFICYHMAFEHDADGDQPCAHINCPLFLLQTYRLKLESLGIHADDVVEDALQKRRAQKKG